jgi:hypothetical protein
MRTLLEGIISMQFNDFFYNLTIHKRVKIPAPTAMWDYNNVHPYVIHLLKVTSGLTPLKSTKPASWSNLKHSLTCFSRIIMQQFC